jgi:hypothetical protein
MSIDSKATTGYYLMRKKIAFVWWANNWLWFGEVKTGYCLVRESMACGLVMERLPMVWWGEQLAIWFVEGITGYGLLRLQLAMACWGNNLLWFVEVTKGYKVWWGNTTNYGMVRELLSIGFVEGTTVYMNWWVNNWLRFGERTTKIHGVATGEGNNQIYRMVWWGNNWLWLSEEKLAMVCWGNSWLWFVEGTTEMACLGNNWRLAIWFV